MLVSGESKPGIQSAIEAALAPFTIEIREVQKIDLGGRLIIAFLIQLDPAHAEAIDGDLATAATAIGCDVAMELI